MENVKPSINLDVGYYYLIRWRSQQPAPYIPSKGGGLNNNGVRVGRCVDQNQFAIQTGIGERVVEIPNDDIIKKLNRPPKIVGGEIHSIEWRDDKPFSVTVYEADKSTWSRTYDVDYCVRDKQLYYSWSGGGHANVSEGRSGLDVLPDIKVFDKLIEHFDMMEGETQYCNQCNDHLPTHQLCEHIYWDEDECWWKERQGGD